MSRRYNNILWDNPLSHLKGPDTFIKMKVFIIPFLYLAEFSETCLLDIYKVFKEKKLFKGKAYFLSEHKQEEI